MTFPELYVLRHGETEWNVAGRMQGHMNSPLTPKGCAQAQRQGEILAAVDLTGFSVLSSPQSRAIQTAALALADKVAMIQTRELLREIGVGEWTGRLRATLPGASGFTETPDGALELYERAPGGEGFARLATRCQTFLASLEGPAVLVTHGITSRMLRSLVLGQGPAGVAKMPGGQGVVYHLKDGVQKRLT